MDMFLAHIKLYSRCFLNFILPKVVDCAGNSSTDHPKFQNLPIKSTAY